MDEVKFRKFSDLYDSYGTELIDRYIFHELIIKLEAPNNVTKYETDFIFNSIDIFNTNLISRYDIVNFFRDYSSGNLLTQKKIEFRSIDLNRDSYLSFDEFNHYLSFMNENLNINNILNDLDSSELISFNLFFYFTTNIKLQTFIDPYDGKLFKKSECCLLL